MWEIKLGIFSCISNQTPKLNLFTQVWRAGYGFYRDIGKNMFVFLFVCRVWIVELLCEFLPGPVKADVTTTWRLIKCYRTCLHWLLRVSLIVSWLGRGGHGSVSCDCFWALPAFKQKQEHWGLWHLPSRTLLLVSNTSGGIWGEKSQLMLSLMDYICLKGKRQKPENHRTFQKKCVSGLNERKARVLVYK